MLLGCPLCIFKKGPIISICELKRAIAPSYREFQLAGTSWNVSSSLPVKSVKGSVAEGAETAVVAISI